MLDANTRGIMQKKADAFLEIQNQYFKDEKNDADMTEYTTQPFWQSMYLSKKRLKEKELISETIIEGSDRRMFFESDTSTAHSIIGNFTRPIKERKKIYSKGKLIYNKKDDKLLAVSAIKAKGDGEFVDCPNCGNTGKISSYIDGCDYCGSKFTVNDFEEKISAFSSSENTPKKVLQVFKKLALFIGGFALILGILSIISIIVAIIVNMMGAPNEVEVFSLVIFMAASELSPIMWQVFIYSGILFIVVLVVAFKLLGKRINHDEIVTLEMPDFSSEDFTQNLEFKLRNIHFASDAKEVNAYATFDLGNVIKNYKDVIECTLSKLTFKKVRKQEDMYYIDSDLICSLTKYRGKKVWMESEKIAVTMSAPSSLQLKRLSNIHCYRCPNCASSIDLLNGGICTYCGTKLDYSKYSWMIENYESKGKVSNPFTKIKWSLLAIYTAVFLIVSGIILAANEDTIFQLAHYEECVEFCIDEYNSLPALDDVVEGVSLLSFEDDATIRTCEYSTRNAGMSATDVAKAYCEYLCEEEGFSLKDKSDGYRMYYRVVTNPELRLEGHLDMEIWFDNKDEEIRIDYSIDDSPYED